MEKIDTYVLSRFQKFSDFSQVQWGKNCYWWALIFTHLCGVWNLFLAWYMYHEKQGIFLPMDWVTLCIYLFMAGVKYFELTELQKMSKRDVPQVLKDADDSLRLVELFVGSFAIFIALDPVMGIVFTWACISYFKRCVPRPPQVRTKETVVQPT